MLMRFFIAAYVYGIVSLPVAAQPTINLSHDLVSLASQIRT
jgi:hypothetical protein